MASLLLVGPQGPKPDLGAALREAGVRGQVALITAGWQERESDDEALIAELGVEAVNLRLHARSEEVFAADTALASGHSDRQLRLKLMHEVYRLRLNYAFNAQLAISVRRLDPGLLEEEQRVSVEVLRQLDRDQLERSLAAHAAYEKDWRPNERPAVARHRDELLKLIEASSALVVAGGHVASLLYRLKLFDVVALAGNRPWVATAAGAMALTERIYLFHDFPPQGTGVAEVLDAGLGLVKDLVVLPDPRKRLRLDDSNGIARFVQRVAPAACVAMDAGARISAEAGRVTRVIGQQLLPDGQVHRGLKT